MKLDRITITLAILMNIALPLTSPLYLKESCTERRSSQNGHKNSKRNINMKSATMTMAHRIKNFMYRTVVLQERENKRIEAKNHSNIICTNINKVLQFHL